jgi:hypothetical protein
VRIRPAPGERTENKMKTLVVLCAMTAVALFLEACADQGSNAVANNDPRYHGLIDRGSVAPVYGGPAPGPVRQRAEP